MCKKRYVLRLLNYVATEHVSNFSMRPGETICFRAIALECSLKKKYRRLREVGHLLVPS